MIKKTGNKVVITDIILEWAYFNGINDYDGYSCQFNLSREDLNELNVIALALPYNRDRLTFSNPVKASRKAFYNGKLNQVVFKDHTGKQHKQSTEPVEPIVSIPGKIVASPYAYSVAGNVGIKLTLYGMLLTEPIQDEPEEDNEVEALL